MFMSDSRFGRLLNHIVMLAYLQPYLKNVDTFNQNRTQISQALQDFLFKYIANPDKTKTYTPEEILKSFTREVVENNPTDEETQTYDKQLQLKDALLINAFSDRLYEELAWRYTSEEQALKDFEKDTFPLSQMAREIAEIRNENVESVTAQMKAYIKAYFDIQATLDPYNTKVTKNKDHKQRQKKNNDTIQNWANQNLHQHDLLAHLGLWMQADPNVKKMYLYLLSMNNGDTPLSQEQIKDMEKTLCLTTGRISMSEKGIESEIISDVSIDTLLPAMFNDTMTLASHAYFHIDALGQPHDIPYQKQLEVAQRALFTALVFSVGITSLFTFIPIIPMAAEHSLNQLYSTIFLASSTPVLSVTAVIGISIAFMFVIDILTIAAVKHCRKREEDQVFNNGELYIISMREKFIGPKLTKEAAHYTDAQLLSMDAKVDENNRPTRTPTMALKPRA